MNSKSKKKNVYKKRKLKNSLRLKKKKTIRKKLKGGKHDLTIIMTRHAESCNNVVSDPRLKLFEPGITEDGIIKTYLWSTNVKKDYYKIKKGDFPFVFVSNLIRTWCTAVLLYNQEQTLNLLVSPYLKEKHTKFAMVTFHTGNHPESIRKMCINFLFFLNYIYGNKSPDNSQLNKLNVPDDFIEISENINLLIHTDLPPLDKLSNEPSLDELSYELLCINYKKEEAGYKMRFLKINSQKLIDNPNLPLNQDKIIPTKIILSKQINNEEQRGGQLGSVTEEATPFKLCTDSYTDINFEEEDGYVKNGNIYNFSNWSIRRYSSGKKRQHVVSHSNLMLDFVEKENKNTPEDIELIKGTNCNTLEIGIEYGNSKIESVKIIGGYSAQTKFNQWQGGNNDTTLFCQSFYNKGELMCDS